MLKLTTFALGKILLIYSWILVTFEVVSFCFKSVCVTSTSESSPDELEDDPEEESESEDEPEEEEESSVSSNEFEAWKKRDENVYPKEELGLADAGKN